jgi:DNA-directed RNA polymerase subunit K
MAKKDTATTPAAPAFRYTVYEKARLIGARALQISMGAPFTVKLNDEELAALNYNPVEIAKLEFAQGVIPIDVNRRLPE